jgi:hypothetical protein
VRAEAFRASVVCYRLGPRIAPAISWVTRTTLPTFLTFEPVWLAAAAAELWIERWLYADSDETALEACQANWRPAVRELAAGPQEVPSVAESLAAFNRRILPMERAPGTGGMYLTHRRTILTWPVCRMEGRAAPPPTHERRPAASFPLSRLPQDRQRGLEPPPPLSGKREYKRLIHSLSCFQSVPRRIFFPIYADAVNCLLSLKLPDHPACQGLRGGCASKWRTSSPGATVWPAPPQQSPVLDAPRRPVCRSATFGSGSMSWQAISASGEERL